MSTDPSKLMNDTYNAFVQSVGREPHAHEEMELERIVAQEVRDQMDAENQ